MMISKNIATIGSISGSILNLGAQVGYIIGVLSFESALLFSLWGVCLILTSISSLISVQIEKGGK